MATRSIPCYRCASSAKNFTSAEEPADVISVSSGCCVVFALQQWLLSETRPIINSDAMQSLLFYGGVIASDTKFAMRIQRNLQTLHTTQQLSPDVIRAVCNPKANGLQLVPVWTNLIKQWSEESMRDLVIDVKDVVQNCPHIISDALEQTIVVIGGEQEIFFEMELLTLAYKLKIMEVLCVGSMWHAEVTSCMKAIDKLSAAGSYTEAIYAIKVKVDVICQHTPVKWIMDIPPEPLSDLIHRIRCGAINSILSGMASIPNESARKMIIVATLKHITSPTKQCSETIEAVVSDITMSTQDIMATAASIGDTIDSHALFTGFTQPSVPMLKIPTLFSELACSIVDKSLHTAIVIANQLGHTMVAVHAPSTEWMVYIPCYQTTASGTSGSEESRIYRLGSIANLDLIIPRQFKEKQCRGWVLTPNASVGIHDRKGLIKFMVDCQMNLLTKARMLSDVNFTGSADPV